MKRKKHPCVVLRIKQMDKTSMCCRLA